MSNRVPWSGTRLDTVAVEFTPWQFMNDVPDHADALEVRGRSHDGHIVTVAFHSFKQSRVETQLEGLPISVIVPDIIANGPDTPDLWPPHRFTAR